MSQLYDIEQRTRDDDSYMYSYSSYTFFVVSKQYGDLMCRFSGSRDGDSAGWREDGVQSVKIDGHFAVATDAEGKEERVELPVKLELSEYGKKLKLTFADGRVEKRDRQEAYATSKYGEPYSIRPLRGGKP